MKKNIFDKLDLFILSIIIIVAFVFRLYQINTPLADLHSWRQADTAAVARNFTRYGFDLMHPRYDDLSNLQTGIDNPQGYRMVEFPIYSAIFGFLYKLVPIFLIEVYGRLTSIFFSLITLAVIYYLLRKESSRLAAVIGAIVFAVFPFFVFFSRVVLPEPTAVAFIFLSIFFLYQYSNTKNFSVKALVLLIASILFFSSSILVKPTTIFYGFTFLYLFFKKYEFSLLKKIDVYIFFGLSLLPLLLWRIYILKYPEGIPASDWLISGVNTYEGLKNIFLRPAFFRWIFFERLNNMIFGGYLTALFIIGIFKKNQKYFLHTLLISSFVYLFTFEGGNVQHEYYQTIILPTLAIFIGLGVESVYIFDKKNFISNFYRIPILLVIFVLSFFFSYYRIRDFYNTPSDLTSIAKIIKTITQPEDKIITDRLGDTTMLYLADRKGWPAYSGNLDEFKRKGYKYIVTANIDLIKELKSNKLYKLTFENDKFTIFEL